MSDLYYVYAYLDPRNPGPYSYDQFVFSYQPFYIGKGKGKQHSSHLNEARNPGSSVNKKKANKIRKIQKVVGHDPIIVIIESKLSEDKTFELEKKLISIIGRHDRGEGPLCNLTDGGDGCSGYRHNDETISRIKEKLTGRIISKETRKRMSAWQKGRSKGPMSEATKRKIRKRFLGDNNPAKRPEVRERLSALNRGIKNPMFGRSLSEKRKKDISKNSKEMWKSLQHRKMISEMQRENQQRLRDEDPIRYSHVARERAFQGWEGNEKRRNKLADESSKFWKITKPDGSEEIIKNLTQFCRMNSLSKYCMYNIAGGAKITPHKGFLCERLNKGEEIICTQQSE